MKFITYVMNYPNIIKNAQNSILKYAKIRLLTDTKYHKNQLFIQNLMTFDQ